LLKFDIYAVTGNPSDSNSKDNAKNPPITSQTTPSEHSKKVISTRLWVLALLTVGCALCLMLQQMIRYVANASHPLGTASLHEKSG
jgi:hypothetical protein